MGAYMLLREKIRYKFKLGHNQLHFFCSKIHLTNREMGNHTTIINALTKIPALWIAQSKETFLPQYIYNLCRDYMSSDDDKKRYEPVEVCLAASLMFSSIWPVGVITLGLLLGLKPLTRKNAAFFC
jgi:hypothetical protein